jgi:hypothetical protein
MLVHIVVGVIACAVIAAPVLAHFCSSLTVPPKDLVARWRRETAAPRRP